jgi:hypothetical protein
MDVGSLRINHAVVPHDGAGGASGMELLHYPYNQSVLQSYDREHSAWLDFYLNAKNINLQPQGGGKVGLPAGTAQALVGNWYATSGYSVPATGTWYESDVRVNFTSTGFPIRIEFHCTVYAQTAGGVIYIGLGFDGTLYWPTMAIGQSAGANAPVPFSGVTYAPLPSIIGIPIAGPHRVSIFVYCNTLPTLFHSSSYAGLYVTEQRA